MSNTRPLATRLRCARDLLRIWQAALRDSHKCGVPGPGFGKVTDPQMAAELERFAEARQALTEAIKLVAAAEIGRQRG